MAKSSYALGPNDKAGVLVRVSTDAQAADDKTSLLAQKETCCAEMARFGVPVVAEYTEAGFSGADYYDRPELLRALDDMEAGDFNVLVVAYQSRLSRSRENESKIRRRVQNAGGFVYACDFGLIVETCNQSRLMANVRGDFNEYEKGVIRDRMMGGKEKAAEKGCQPCRTHSPYGYHIVQKNDVIRGIYPPDRVGTYQVVEEEAAHVRAVFAWYAGGASLLEVTRLLWEAGARPKNGGSAWPRRTVLDMLTNTVYKGQATFGRTETRTDEARLLQGLKKTYHKAAPEGALIVVPSPVIVDAQTWEVCQTRRMENKARRSGAPCLRQLLTGFTLCANCGRRVHYENLRGPGKTSGYRCSPQGVAAENRLGGCGGEKVSYFNKERAERLVVQGIAALVTGREVIAAAIDQFSQLLTGEGEREAAAERARVWKKRVSDLERKQSAAVQAQINGVLAGVDASAYMPVLAGLQTELRTAIAELTAARAACAASPVPIDAAAVAAFVARALASVEAVLMSDAIPQNEKNAVLIGIVDRVHLEREAPREGKRNKHPGAATIWLKPLFNEGVATVRHISISRHHENW